LYTCSIKSFECLTSSPYYRDKVVSDNWVRFRAPGSSAGAQGLSGCNWFCWSAYKYYWFKWCNWFCWSTKEYKVLLEQLEPLEQLDCLEQLVLQELSGATGSAGAQISKVLLD
jgi:hypothetical protein